MAQVQLNWSLAAVGAPSTGQQVQYRLKGDTDWTTAATVAASVTTYTVTPLLDNELYEFRIVNVCSIGGPTPSGVIEKIKISCPAVTVGKTYERVTYSFASLDADIVDYLVILRNAADTADIASIVKVNGGTVSGEFTGLSASTAYKVRVVPRTASSAYTKTDCAAIDVTTDAAPACNAPTGVSAVMS